MKVYRSSDATIEPCCTEFDIGLEIADLHILQGCLHHEEALLEHVILLLTGATDELVGLRLNIYGVI